TPAYIKKYNEGRSTCLLLMSPSPAPLFPAVISRSPRSGRDAVQFPALIFSGLPPSHGLIQAGGVTAPQWDI
ncbi:hypothetical protein JTE90_021034, partial [Oedothorax gibbosus]